MRNTLLICLLLSSSCFAGIVRYDLKDAALRNLVHFVSDAPLEKVMGLSSSLSGWLELNPDKLGEGIKGELEVDLRTFHTGTESRNEYVREGFLNTAEHPIATYRITRLVNASKTKLADGKPVSVKLEGVLNARGLAKPQSMIVKLVWFKESEVTKQRLGGNLLRVSASFDLDSAAYDVTIPPKERARYSRFVQVQVDAVGTDQPPARLPATESAKPKDPEETEPGN